MTEGAEKTLPSIGSIEEYNNIISKGKTLILFYSPTCTACHMATPVVKRYLSSVDTDIKLYIANIEDIPELNSQFELRPVPLTVLVVDGMVVEKMRSAGPRWYRKVINAHCNTDKRLGIPEWMTTPVPVNAPSLQMESLVFRDGSGNRFEVTADEYVNLTSFAPFYQMEQVEDLVNGFKDDGRPTRVSKATDADGKVLDDSYTFITIEPLS